VDTLIVVFGVVIVVGIVLVIYGTVAENRWGINFSAVSCPSCKAPLPPSERPVPRGRHCGVVILAQPAELRSISGDDW
jgi:hypothetical protein